MFFHKGSLNPFDCFGFQAYTSLASSEIIESVEVIDSNLPVENYQKAMEVFSEAVRDIIKVGDVINLIHNEALQNLPDVRQRFFIRYSLSRMGPTVLIVNNFQV